ncbi:virulence factor SrfC family protein [Sodalis sp. RH20]|uniref:virulence factor SrfC family protein n=1 Tax=unclassified Sodalis (in: enterobacteria) TaxID=2636512 RepID=UPI0039B469EC
MSQLISSPIPARRKLNPVANPLAPQLQNQLHNQLRQVLQGIDQAIDWIAATRRHAPRLDMEAGRLGIKLRRCRLQASHLYNASHTAGAIGFFGQSARGKLHLITALTVGQDDRLSTTLGGKRLDVLSLIEPQSRASGLVLRFAQRVQAENAAYPVQLSLLSEADIAMLLFTLSLREAGGENTARDLDDRALDDRLDRLLARRQGEPVAGMSGDAVVAIWDYVSRHDRRRQKQLETRFWPAAVELAPCLSVEDRAELFSVLWRGRADLSDAYRHFAAIAQHLGGAQHVLAPLGALVDDTMRQADGILDIASLSRLHSAADPLLQVIPMLNGRAGKPVELTMAELAMLAVELLMPLDAGVSGSGGAQVDFIDFAGIDGSLETTAATGAGGEPAYPLAPALLRARCAYLPERYTDAQTVNVLMVCTAAQDRAAVAEVGRLLDYWVRRSQGENAGVRGRRKPALIWALTRFDQRVVHGTNYDAAVQRYVGNPGDTWGTLLALDSRGVNALAAYLAPAAQREAGLERLGEQTKALQAELAENLLGEWQQAAAEDAETLPKQHVAHTLLKALQARAGMHGELLEHLLPTRDEMRRLYLQLPPDAAGHTEPAADGAGPFGVGIAFDLLSAPEAPTGQVINTADFTGATDDKMFARNVQRYWINHLRNLPENAPLLALLGIARPTMAMLMAELITAAIRLDILGSLEHMLMDMAPAGLPPESKADRQVARALAVLGDFVAWLGFTRLSDAQRPDSRINPGHKIFARPAAPAHDIDASHRLTRLNAAPVNNTAFYVYDWLVGLNILIRQNAGYAGGAEISLEQRQRLGAIINLITAAEA